MALTCPVCERPGVDCICTLIQNKEKDMNCNENNRAYPHKGMAPVEIANPIDRKWRQTRDKANKEMATRTAIVELEETILARAKEIEVEMAEAMTLGGLHPNTRSCMDY